MYVSKKLVTAILVLFFASVIACICGAVYYMSYYTKTPQYSLYQAVQAVRDRDSASFDYYVNVRSIVSKYTIEVMKKDAKKEYDPMYVALMPIMQEAAVNEMVTEVDTLIDSGKAVNQLGMLPKEAVLNFDGLDKAINDNDMAVDKLTVEEQGNTATIHVDLVNKKSNKTFALDLVAKQLKKGHWQIIEVKNIEQLKAIANQ